MHLGRDFQAQGVELDEAGGVVLVVGLGRVGIHRGDVRIVKAHRGFAAGNHDVALIQLHPHGAGHVLLALGHERLQRQPFRREPVAVIHQLRVARDERVAQVHDLPVHRKAFHLPVRVVQNRAAGRLIHAPRFHAHVAVLHHVHPPDAVLAAELVERLHHAERQKFFAVHRDAIALHEIEQDEFRFVRRVFGENGERGERAAKFRVAGVHPRVFENAGLVGNVQKIPVARKRFLRAGMHGDFFLRAIRNHFRATGKFAAIPRVPPRGDDLQIRRERGGGQFEAHLVIPLPGRAVGDGVGLFLFGDFHHALGDERARDAGAEKILAFVNRAGVDDGINEVAGEFLLQIVNVDFGRAGLARLRFEAGEFVLLPDVRAEGDHFGVVFFFDPRKQHRGVEAARIG